MVTAFPDAGAGRLEITLYVWQTILEESKVKGLEL